MQALEEGIVGKKKWEEERARVRQVDKRRRKRRGDKNTQVHRP